MEILYKTVDKALNEHFGPRSNGCYQHNTSKNIKKKHIKMLALKLFFLYFNEVQLGLLDKARWDNEILSNEMKILK